MPLPSKRNFEITNEGIFLVKVRPDQLTQELSQMLTTNYVINLGNSLLNGPSVPDIITDFANDVLDKINDLLDLDGLNDLVDDVTELVEQGIETFSDLVIDAAKDFVDATGTPVVISEEAKEIINAVTSSVAINSILDKVKTPAIFISHVFYYIEQVHHLLKNDTSGKYSKFNNYIMSDADFNRLSKFRYNNCKGITHSMTAEGLAVTYGILDYSEDIQYRKPAATDFNDFMTTGRHYISIAIALGLMPENSIRYLNTLTKLGPLEKVGAISSTTVKNDLDSLVRDISSKSKHVIGALKESIAGSSLFESLDVYDTWRIAYVVTTAAIAVHDKFVKGEMPNELQKYRLTDDTFIWVTKFVAQYNLAEIMLTVDSSIDMARSTNGIIRKGDFNWMAKACVDYLSIAIGDGTLSNVQINDLYRWLIDRPGSSGVIPNSGYIPNPTQDSWGFIPIVTVGGGTNTAVTPGGSGTTSNAGGTSLKTYSDLSGLVGILQTFYSEPDPAKISPVLIGYGDRSSSDTGTNDTVEPEPYLLLRTMQDMLRYIEEEYKSLLEKVLPNDGNKLAAISRYRTTFSTIIAYYKKKITGNDATLSVDQSQLNDISMHLNKTFANECLNYFLSEREVTLSGKWTPPYSVDSGNVFYYPVDKLYAELKTVFGETITDIGAKLLVSNTTLTDMEYYPARSIRYKANSELNTQTELFSYLMSPILTTFLDQADSKLFDTLNVCQPIFGQSRFFSNFIRNSLHRVRNAVFSNQLSDALESSGIVV